ncbi:MAG: thiamine phosphate synthase [Erythrobacter sp.]|nr:thiamine phosphate synthase [Erythrobacter sp.]
MTACQPSAPLPLLWLLSDARNDARLEETLDRLPPESGFVYRHYHLDPQARAARFAELAERARRHGHRAILSGTSEQASEWGADGIYGAPSRLSPSRAGLLRLATAHDAAQLREAERAGADGVFVSPVFPTRSHEGGATLGVDGFRALAQATALPVIALGGMTPERATALDWPRWGAIDGLSRSPNSA